MFGCVNLASHKISHMSANARNLLHYKPFGTIIFNLDRHMQPFHTLSVSQGHNSKLHKFWAFAFFCMCVFARPPSRRVLLALEEQEEK